MSRYAQGTTVSASKSKAELQRVLERYGASAVMVGEAFGRSAFVAFQMKGCNVKLDIPLPDQIEDYRRTETGLTRDDYTTEKFYLQACKARWRTVLLLVKAKLEAVEMGHSTIEREFLYDIMLPDGSTFGEALSDGKLDKVLGPRDGSVPLLPGKRSA